MSRTGTEALLRRFEDGPARIESVLGGLSDPHLTIRARGPATWSIQEIVAHLADSEIVGAARIRLVLAGFGGSLPVYDQDAWTREFGAGSRDRDVIDEALAVFRSLRRSTASLLRRATAASLEQRAIHPDNGEVSVLDLLALYAEHAERHRAQIVTIRDLAGVPIEAGA